MAQNQRTSRARYESAPKSALGSHHPLSACTALIACNTAKSQFQTDQGISRFALPRCFPCVKVIGSPVTVEHNPIDYFSRRSNTARCEQSHTSEGIAK
jgi:hypothetical protein